MEGNEEIREVMHSYAKRSHEAPDEQPGLGTGLMGPESPGGSVLNESVLLNFIEETLRRLAAVEATAHENTQSVQSFAVSLELIGKKVEHGAKKSQQLQSRVAHLEQERTGLQENRAHLDAHEQEWSLNVSGMQERGGENVRQTIIDLFSAVCPQIAAQLPHSIGLVHRLGARAAARARCVRVRFNARDHRDRIWKSAKTSELLKQLNIKVTEDRSEGDDQVRKEAHHGAQRKQVQTLSTRSRNNKTKRAQDHQDHGAPEDIVKVQIKDEDDSTESEDSEGDSSTQSSEEDSRDKDDDSETESDEEVLDKVNEFIEVPVNSGAFKEERKEYQETQSNQEGTGLQHQCLVCGKSFSRSFHLKAHQVTHTGKKMYFCPECGKSFTQLTNLKTHQRIHTGEKPYRCSDCGRSFTHSATLISHQRIHTGEKPYQCSHCGKRFSQSINLKTHQRIHTGERPYQCTDCDKAYAHLSTLITHRRVHTGEKPYQCSQCGKRFSQSINLKTHQRIHTGEKPYQCAECGKKYSHLTTFLSHQRIHTGERPYRCAVCGVSFSRSSTLSNHLKTHAGEGTHRGESLKEHARVHAGLKPYRSGPGGKTLTPAGYSKEQIVHAEDKHHPRS